MDPHHEDDATQPDAPWWLQPGPESCDVCLQTAQIEAIYRCHACDRAVCLACSVTVVERRIVLCPDCAREGGG